jgi:hypothetical protein
LTELLSTIPLANSSSTLFFLFVLVLFV